MSASAVGLSRKIEPGARDAQRSRAAARPEAKAEDGPFADIAANTFYGIMFDEAASPEEKQAAVAKALTFAGSKEESRSRAKEFERFKEYLQDARERMNTEIIKLMISSSLKALDWRPRLARPVLSYAMPFVHSK